MHDSDDSHNSHDIENHSADGSETDPNAPTLTHIPRILIVEDTIELGEIIQAALKGMNVLTFHEVRGTSALRVYNDIRPDLVMLDIGLPDMTGWKLLDSMRETQTLLRRPAIVVITAFGDPANRLMGKLQGVDTYLVKPFKLNDVRAIVRRILFDESPDASSIPPLTPLPPTPTISAE